MASSMAGLMMSASAMAVRSGLHAPGYPAGIVGMAAHIRATWQAAGMIPMSVVSSMRIAVHTVVHMGSSLGTARDIAPVMAVLTGQRTAVDSAGTVNMRIFQAATWQAAGMIPMSVVSSMRIAVHTVVHMGSSLGTARDIAPVMAVLTGQRTAVDSAKAVLGLLRLCTFRNHAGNTYLTFLCSILRFQGTFIDRIRDNTASYHGNRNKRNG